MSLSMHFAIRILTHDFQVYLADDLSKNKSHNTFWITIKDIVIPPTKFLFLINQTVVELTVLLEYFANGVMLTY